MKTFGQVITVARKKAGLTQKEVAEPLRREDGRKVLPPYLNDLEDDGRYPPENSVIDQPAKILRISADVLYFHANRLSDDLNRAVAVVRKNSATLMKHGQEAVLVVKFVQDGVGHNSA